MSDEIKAIKAQAGAVLADTFKRGIAKFCRDHNLPPDLTAVSIFTAGVAYCEAMGFSTEEILKLLAAVGDSLTNASSQPPPAVH